MNVVLSSPDVGLFQLCREILSECGGTSWRLSAMTPGVGAADADLFIWDGTPSVDFPRETDHHLSRHLFLLHRTDVAAFRENLGVPEAAILLKPVTRATLSTFLGLAASSFRNHNVTERSLRSDRDEILQCLIQSNLHLQQYDQERTNFLTRAVHDFRAPLTASGGYCGLLISGSLGPLSDEQRDVLQRMHHSLKRLSRMASAMFELGVSRHVKRQPELRPGDIRPPLEQALYEITPLAECKNISVSIDLVPEEGVILLEAAQIEQVLINLLENACKFTPQEGSIEVRGYPSFWERRSAGQGCAPALDRRRRDSRLPNSYRVDILNSGPSIPPEHIGRLFEEYSSYSGGRDRSGGGLGLAICKMIVVAHGGRIWMENTEFGPRFSFVLPAGSTAPEHATESELQLLSEEIN